MFCIYLNYINNTIHIYKTNSDFEKQLALLIISNIKKESQYFFTVKTLSALLQGII